MEDDDSESMKVCDPVSLQHYRQDTYLLIFHCHTSGASLPGTYLSSTRSQEWDCLKNSIMKT